MKGALSLTPSFAYVVIVYDALACNSEWINTCIDAKIDTVVMSKIERIILSITRTI